ncbi:MAG: hypothetical protein HUU01_20405, partial [Saprospiraceae bacterium]|nr:hypothetical protein [Saprospiraceae bacterium]
MLKIRSILSSQLVYCFAIAAGFVLLPVALPGQVEEVVEMEAPVPVETDEQVAEPVLESETYDEEPATYSWENEYRYHEEPIEARSIDETNWKKTIEGLDFNNKATPKTEEEMVRTPPDPPDFPSFFGNGLLFAWLLRGLLLVGGIFIIVLIVRNVLQMKPTPKDVVLPVQNAQEIDLQHIEENLNTADLDPLIQQA